MDINSFSDIILSKGELHMKRILLVLVIAVSLTTVGCSSTGDNQGKETGRKTIEKDNGKPEEEQADDTYKAGEEAIIKDDKGNDMYSLKVDSVKLANDFEYKEDFSENTKQIVEVDYTYKNIAKDDTELYIHGEYLQVVDQDGKAAESSSMFPKQQPQEASVGVSVRVQSYYGLENESEEVQVMLRSEGYNTTVIFKVPVK